jgi:hypothetical protein
MTSPGTNPVRRKQTRNTTEKKNERKKNNRCKKKNRLIKKLSWSLRMMS